MGAEGGKFVPGGEQKTRTLGLLMALALGILLVTLVQAIPGVQNFLHSVGGNETETMVLTQESMAEDIVAEEVFMVVEQMPELIGGLSALAAKVRYPQIARGTGIEGKVFLQFVVAEDGSVINPIVIRGIGAGCDEAALAALKSSKFRPGKQHGINVAVKMSLPVTFKLK